MNLEGISIEEMDEETKKGAKRKPTSSSTSCNSNNTLEQPFNRRDRRPSLNPDSLLEGIKRMEKSQKDISSCKMDFDHIVDGSRKVREEIVERERKQSQDDQENNNNNHSNNRYSGRRLIWPPRAR